MPIRRYMMIRPFSILPWKVTRMTDSGGRPGRAVPSGYRCSRRTDSRRRPSGILRAYRSRHRRDLRPGLERIIESLPPGLLARLAGSWAILEGVRHWRDADYFAILCKNRGGVARPLSTCDDEQQAVGPGRGRPDQSESDESVSSRVPEECTPRLHQLGHPSTADPTPFGPS